jgi:hypothetical protein
LGFPGTLRTVGAREAAREKGADNEGGSDEAAVGSAEKHDDKCMTLWGECRYCTTPRRNLASPLSMYAR